MGLPAACFMGMGSGYGNLYGNLYLAYRRPVPWAWVWVVIIFIHHDDNLNPAYRRPVPWAWVRVMIMIIIIPYCCPLSSMAVGALRVDGFGLWG
jgi:hypothetical protein